MARVLMTGCLGASVVILESIPTTLAVEAGTRSGQQAQAGALKSKLDLLRRLVVGSPAAERIRNGGDPAADALLDAAVSACERADAALRAGDAASADRHIGSGLAAMQKASVMVTDPNREQEAQRARYGQLSQRVDSFTSALERILAEKKDLDPAAVLDRDGLDRLRAGAQASARDEDYAGANRQLAEAADLVEAAVSRARDKETLLHELNFATPHDEYDYEKQRNHSYTLLVDLLKSEQGGADTRFAYMDKLIEANRLLCERAERLVAEGDIRGGIEQLEQATETLARALRASGVAF